MSKTERIHKAMNLAIKWHGDQKYGDLPYVVHLQKVYEVGLRFESHLESYVVDIECVQKALWLHDILEDTDITKEKLILETSEGTYYIVWACTDAKGKNRKERKYGTLDDPGPYIKLKNNPIPLFVKLCDRIANVEASIAGQKDFFNMYVKEHDEFLSELYSHRDLINAPLWMYLNQLIYR